MIMLLLPLSVWAENASNVRVHQRNKDIIITYDLAKSSYVQVSVATDSSTTFTLDKDLAYAQKQTPCVIPSNILGSEWQNWTLK